MSYRDAKLEVDTQLGDGFISSMKDSQKGIMSKVSKLTSGSKNKIENNSSGDKEDDNKEAAVEVSVAEGPSMKSGIYMAGTSMGSYSKPMMKGSGLEMKCGSQVGKHMKR
jgi:hypothetical protein